MSAGLHIRLLGPLEVERDGVRPELPQSRKTRSLMAYLVAEARPHTRGRLGELLWSEVDDPRGGLRWSLSKLRPLLDDEAATRLVAERDSVAFVTQGAKVDLAVVRGLPAGALEGVAEADLLRAVALFRGEFLEDLDLPDVPDFHAWCIAERQQLRRTHERLLDHLVDRLADRPEQALVHARRRVQLDRTDQRAQARLLDLLVAADRAQEAADHHAALTRGLDERGEAASADVAAAWVRIRQALAGKVPEAPAGTAGTAAGSQDIQFCMTGDGVRIAWAGSGAGPPLLKTANWLNHLEYDWESRIWRHWLRELGRDHRLIRYDERGNGLSDREVDELSLRAFVADLEAVADAAGLQRYPLLAISQGCAVAVAHAVRHPERVSRMVLFGGFARGWCGWGPRAVEQVEALMTLARHGWGRSQPAFRQVFTSLFYPGADAEQMQDFNELQRRSTSAENAVRLLRAFGELDVTDLLSQVRVPTLVVHARRDALVRFEEGRKLAAGIPGARFVPLDSANHVPSEDEPAWGRFLQELRAFLAG